MFITVRGILWLGRPTKAFWASSVLFEQCPLTTYIHSDGVFAKSVLSTTAPASLFGLHIGVIAAQTYWKRRPPSFYLLEHRTASSPDDWLAYGTSPNRSWRSTRSLPVVWKRLHATATSQNYCSNAPPCQTLCHTTAHWQNLDLQSMSHHCLCSHALTRMDSWILQAHCPPTTLWQKPEVCQVTPPSWENERSSWNSCYLACLHLKDRDCSTIQRPYMCARAEGHR